MHSSCFGVPSLFTDGSILFQFYFCSIDCCSVNFEKIFIKKMVCFAVDLHESCFTDLYVSRVSIRRD